MKQNGKTSKTGNTLDLLMAGGPLGMDGILGLAIQIADALDSIHRNKRFYGYLNPAVIEVDPQTLQVVLPEIEEPGKPLVTRVTTIWAIFLPSRPAA